MEKFVNKTMTNQVINKLLFNNCIQPIMKYEEQGICFLFQTSKGLYHYFNGNISIDSGSGKIDAFSHFRLASVTKQFIAYGIYTLIKQGKIEEDLNIQSIFPQLPDYFSLITIKHLLNHTSGVIDYETWEPSGKDGENRPISDDEIMRRLTNYFPTYFVPGTTYRYSNTGYVILSEIIRNISGMSTFEYLQKYVFDVVGLKSMGNVCDLDSIDNRVIGRKIENGVLISKDSGWSTFTFGDGGIYANGTDLLIWLKYLQNNFSLLKDSFFLVNHPPLSIGSNYAWGEVVRCQDSYHFIYHCGDTVGGRTAIGFCPEKNMQFALLTALDGVDMERVIENIDKMLKENKIEQNLV